MFEFLTLKERNVYIDTFGSSIHLPHSHDLGGWRNLTFNRSLEPIPPIFLFSSATLAPFQLIDCRSLREGRRSFQLDLVPRRSQSETLSARRQLASRRIS